MTEREIFLEALEMSTPEARAAYLKGACSGDFALQRKVEELLKEHFANDSLLAGSAVAVDRPGIVKSPVEEAPAAVVGRYKLLEKIGEGGFGEVWMAEQREPVKRRVALKIIKLGMDSRQIVARFEAERQALAMMDHANIAKVFDADVTDSGRPYFVMELVRGIKITEYCDQHQVPTRERLDLFIKVCHAIQHAHQKGIIHRDIKPSNILVTIVDGAPVPKIIDFGIAKATTGQPLTDKTLFTAFQQFIGTPAYMSPEQAEMSGVDIDTRTDIYSLGVVLYELLTGRTPFDAEALLRAGIDEIRRTIRDQEPPKPSTRLHALSQGDLTTTAQARHVDGHNLIQTVKGDLDWIVMKCLEKERGRRYETVNGLALDVQRHLNTEAVVARPPSRWYEFQKTVKRHKVGFAAAGAVVLALAVGLGVATWTLVKEKKARERAVAAEQQQAHLRQKAEANEQKAETAAASSAQVAQFMKDMLRSVGPSVAKGRDTAMLKEILDKTTERIGTDLKNQPQVEAELRSTLAATYIELGEFVAAETMAREALRIRRSTLEKSDPLIGASMVQLASAKAKRNQSSNHLAEAEGLVREALVSYGEVGGDERTNIVGWVALHAGILNMQRRFPEAESVSRKALATRRELLGPENQEVASSLDNLALVLRDCGKLDEAEQLLREALVMQRKLLGDVSLDTATSLQYLGGILERRKKMRDAEAVYREALAVRRKIYGADNAYTAILLTDIGGTLAAQRKHAEAEAAYREALELRRKIHGPDTAYTSRLLTDIGGTLTAQGKHAEATSVYRDLVAAQKKIDGETNRNVEIALNYLARSLEAQGELTEAEAAWREELAVERTLSGNGHRFVINSLQDLTRVLQSRGKQAEAVAVLREELDRARAPDGNGWASTNSGLGVLLHHFAEVLWNQKAFKQARSPAEEGWAFYQQHPEWAENERGHAYKVLDEVLTSLNDQAALESLHRDELARLRGKLSAEDPKLADFLATVALSLLVQKEFTEAEAPARESLAIREKAMPDEWRTFNSRSLVGGSLLGQKKYAEAESFLLSGYEGMKQREKSIPAASKARIPEAIQRVAELYEAIGQPEKAAKWKKKLEFDKAQAEK